MEKSLINKIENCNFLKIHHSFKNTHVLGVKNNETLPHYMDLAFEN